VVLPVEKISSKFSNVVPKTENVKIIPKDGAHGNTNGVHVMTL